MECWHADIQPCNLVGAKRPASTNVGTDRATKRSKTVPDAATISAVEERINRIETDQELNSDDDFVGAFDNDSDEDIGSDEHEDEVDEDIVVSAFQFFSTRSPTLSPSLDSPMV